MSRDGLGGGWWRCPRWLGDDLLDGRITPTTFALVALVGSRREAEPGGPGWATNGTMLADALGVTDKTIRNSRRRAEELGLLVEDAVKGRPTIRLWLGPRFRGGSEVGSEVGSESTSESPSQATALNPAADGASGDPEPRNLARGRAHAPRRETGDGDSLAPTSEVDAVVVDVDLSHPAPDAAVVDGRSTPAGDGDESTDGSGETSERELLRRQAIARRAGA